MAAQLAVETGKTHLAIAVAHRAIQNGFEALFTSAAEMIERLSVATRRSELARTLAEYTHPTVLVIDVLSEVSSLDRLFAPRVEGCLNRDMFANRQDQGDLVAAIGQIQIAPRTRVNMAASSFTP